MEKFWKWLMKTDAKGLFVASLVLLAGVTAWWGVNLTRAPRNGDEDKPAKTTKDAPLELAAFKPIGVIGFVSNQFAPETLIVPVNPFHPTFEAIVKALANQSQNGVIVITDKNGNQIPVHFEGDKLVDAQGNPVVSPFQRDLTPRRPGQAQQAGAPTGGQGQQNNPIWGQQRPSARPRPTVQQPPPKPRISFSGVMQRPDGSFASYVSIRTGDKRSTRFVRVGDKIGNATVTASGRDGVELKFDNGETATLHIGDAPLALEAEPGVQ